MQATTIRGSGTQIRHAFLMPSVNSDFGGNASPRHPHRCFGRRTCFAMQASYGPGRGNGDPSTEQGEYRESSGESGQGFQQFLQHDGLVMVLIRRAVDQRDSASLRGSCDFPQGRFLPRRMQLGEIPCPKDRPFAWIMGEPFPQRGARGPFLCPLIDTCSSFADPAWPHTIHKDTQAVIRAGIAINALDPYHDRLRSITRPVKPLSEMPGSS